MIRSGSLQSFGGLPGVVGRPFAGGRHVLRITLRGTGIDPANDRVDLLVRQRDIILEFLHADVAVDVPGGHLARDDTLTNGFGPGARFFKRDQRHRGHGVLAVALFAFGLEDGRDILGKRGSGRSWSLSKSAGRENGKWQNENRGWLHGRSLLIAGPEPLTITRAGRIQSPTYIKRRLQLRPARLAGRIRGPALTAEQCVYSLSQSVDTKASRS